MMGVEGFSERLRSLIGDMSERSFAHQCGIPQPTLRSLLDGKKPTLDTFVKIAHGAGVEMEWLATGEGPQLPGQTQIQTLAPPPVLLPRYDVRASAGAGALVASEDVAEYFSVGRDWLRRMMPPWAPSNAVVGVLENSGDSMWPTIQDGDLLIVVQNVEWRVVERGGIFVFTLDDRLLLKRLQVLDNGDLRVISDNKRYEPFTVRRADIPTRLILHGYVMFAGGKPRNYE